MRKQKQIKKRGKSRFISQQCLLHANSKSYKLFDFYQQSCKSFVNKHYFNLLREISVEKKRNVYEELQKSRLNVRRKLFQTHHQKLILFLFKYFPL